MSSDELRVAIRAVYRDVAAPDWAAPNLDGLADVLRDLSWLPPGPVHISVPALDELSTAEQVRLLTVLHSAVESSAGTAQPVQITLPPDAG